MSSADKACLGATNLLTTKAWRDPLSHSRQIPKPDNQPIGPKSALWDRMFHFYNLHREEFLTHYHKRSKVEITFHMIESKFSQRLRSKTLTAQINEAPCKVLCHNLCVVIQSVHELGLKATFQLR